MSMKIRFLNFKDFVEEYKSSKNSKVQISTGLKKLLGDYERCRLEILDRNNKVLASGKKVKSTK